MNRQQLVEDNVNLVYYLIRKYYPTLINDEDIIQIGMVGLCEAAKRWDSNKSKFSTYAGSWIKNEIKHELQERASRQVEVSLESLMEGNKNEY